MNDGQVIGSAPLVSGVAMLSTNVVTVGPHTLSATYGGDSNLLSSTVSGVPITVLAASFNLFISPAALSIRGGTTASIDVQAVGLGSYSAPLALALGNLPPGSTASFAPCSISLPANVPGHALLKISTQSLPPYTFARSRPPRAHPALPLVLATTTLPLLINLRRRWSRFSSFLISLLAFVLLAGCGDDVFRRVSITPSTTYSLPITATDPATGLVRSATLTLTITP